MCVAWQWNFPNHTWAAGGGPQECLLLREVPKIKIPVHPLDQTSCTVGVQPPLPPAPLPPSPPGARSILYILVDDLRTQLEPYGHTYMHTPHLAKFAASDHTVLFRESHCNSQMCVPTRNSFMSGRRPDTTRVFNDGIGEKHFRIVGPNWTSMPQFFKERGFFATGIGKTFHPQAPPDFDQPLSWSNESEFPYFYPAPVPCPGGNGSDVWCEVTNTSAVFEDRLILAEAQRRLTLASKASQPFFIMAGFHKPHTPYRAPSQFYDLYPPPATIATAADPGFPDDQNLTGLAWFGCLAEGKQYPIVPHMPYPVATQQLLRRAYYASVSFFDDNVGQLLDTVDQLGLSNKIAVVFHADHGYQLGERNIWCKETNFNLATHVPLMIRAPWLTRGAPATSANAMVELVDMFPTVAELAGCAPLDPAVKNEPPLGGTSLVPLLVSAQRSVMQSVRTRAPALASSPLPGFNSSLSQYARARCYDDLFVNGHNDPGCTLGTFIGYSIRTSDTRYTRWVNVTVDGTPFWGQVMGEELYDEPADRTADNFDTSERVNLAYRPSSSARLSLYRQLLAEGFGHTAAVLDGEV